MVTWAGLLTVAMATSLSYSQSEETTCLPFGDPLGARHVCLALTPEMSNSTDKGYLCSLFLDQLACIADHYNQSAEVCRQQLVQLSASGQVKSTYDDFNPTTCPCFDGDVRVIGSCSNTICSLEGASCEEKLDTSENATVCCIDQETYVQHLSTVAPVTVQPEEEGEDKMSGAVIAIIVVVVIVVLTLAVIGILAYLRRNVTRGKKTDKKEVEVYPHPDTYTGEPTLQTGFHNLK